MLEHTAGVYGASIVSLKRFGKVAMKCVLILDCRTVVIEEQWVREEDQLLGAETY